MIGAAAVQRTLVFVGAAGTMSSLQSLRELISERLAAAAEEICRLCEGTIVQYEQELCRQRRLLDICWKPQLQLHHIVLPQHWLTEEDLCNHQRNFRVDQENPEPPQTPEELQDPEPSLMKEEPEELCISQDEEQLDLKQETETWMEIPTLEEHVDSEADGNNQQNLNGTDSLDEEGNQHEESTSTPDEETEPQNRDQKKRRDRSHVQSVASSHMSEVLTQHWLADEDLCNQKKNFRVDQENPEPSLMKEELQDPEPSPMKEEPEELCISQDEEQLDLKQETETLMEIPTLEEHVDSEADGNNQQIFNGTDSQDEERNQHEESTSTPDEETEPQNRDQRKRRDRSHLQSVDISQMSESHWDSDVRKQFKIATLVKRHKQSPKEKRLPHINSGKGTRAANNMSANMKTKSGEGPYVCKECDKHFRLLSYLKKHMRTHTGEKPFTCKECDRSFSGVSNLKTHMRTHTGEKPFTCKECDRSFGQVINLKTHMRTHTGEKPFMCKECHRSFSLITTLKRHMRTHTGEKPFHCTECDRSFSQISNLKSHTRTHTGEKPFSC
ncbi:hypothetical protein OJAV_G00234840 [Oryzias javanicus]|uniref:C2H2-type domain-containing protein n=1 Tax=Oryzias javanicus TaxID=123683 RepID=A0A437BYT8_ORYJA|nr:hypothetical protein OJAV_G00234840 [Oryzias javanicus]